MNVCAAGCECMLSPHNRVSTLDLPVIYSVTPIFFFVKLRSTSWYKGPEKRFCRAIYLDFLFAHASWYVWMSFVYVACDNLQTHPIFCCEVCDDWSCASQLHCAESIAVKHACTRLCIHATKASKWPLKHHVTYRLAVAIAGLSWRGGLWCLQLC